MKQHQAIHGLGGLDASIKAVDVTHPLGWIKTTAIVRGWFHASAVGLATEYALRGRALDPLVSC